MLNFNFEAAGLWAAVELCSCSSGGRQAIRLPLGSERILSLGEQEELQGVQLHLQGALSNDVVNLELS